MPDLSPSPPADNSTPVALTIAGFDTCAGAGLQADLLTFHNHGYHSLTAMTSLVVETPLLVKKTQPVSPELLRQQLELLLSTYPISTIKIGLLSSPQQVALLAEILAHQASPIVLDPVGISSTGSALQEPGTLDALVNILAPLATLITPNLPEATALLGNEQKLSPENTAQALCDRIGTAVLLTGGHHGDDHQICDLLTHQGQQTSFCDSRLKTPTPLHGTGCTLSSAIAAELGHQKNLKTAITSARRYLRTAIHAHHTFTHSEPLLALNHLPSGGLKGSHDQ